MSHVAHITIPGVSYWRAKLQVSELQLLNNKMRALQQPLLGSIYNVAVLLLIMAVSRSAAGKRQNPIHPGALKISS